MPPRARNFCVREQILKFCRRLETNGLEPVACTPVAQCDFISDFVRIKKFTSAFCPISEAKISCPCPNASEYRTPPNTTSPALPAKFTVSFI